MTYRLGIFAAGPVIAVAKKTFDAVKNTFNEMASQDAHVGAGNISESQAAEGITNLLGIVSKPVFSKVSSVAGLQQFSNLVTDRVKNSITISRGLSQARVQTLRQTTGPSISR